MEQFTMLIFELAKILIDESDPKDLAENDCVTATCTTDAGIKITFTVDWSEGK